MQRTVPHEHAIDGIIFPSIRDRMILLRGEVHPWQWREDSTDGTGRYDLTEAFHGMLNEVCGLRVTWRPLTAVYHPRAGYARPS